jgi:hypothetical protein
VEYSFCKADMLPAKRAFSHCTTAGNLVSPADWAVAVMAVKMIKPEIKRLTARFMGLSEYWKHSTATFKS